MVDLGVPTVYTFLVGTKVSCFAHKIIDEIEGANMRCQLLIMSSTIAPQFIIYYGT